MSQVDHSVRDQMVHPVDHLDRVLKGHENGPVGRCAGGGGRRTLGFVATDGAVPCLTR